MRLIEVIIRDEGRDWYKVVKLFGVPVYHRHDYTQDEHRRPVGFEAFPNAQAEVEEDNEYWPEEFKHKQNG